MLPGIILIIQYLAVITVGSLTLDLVTRRCIKELVLDQLLLLLLLSRDDVLVMLCQSLLYERLENHLEVP